MSSVPYVLPIGDTISSAWEKVKGTKGSVWAAIGVIILFTIGFAIIQAVTKAVFPQLGSIINFISQVILGLMQIGIFYIGIRRALDSPFSWDMIFRVFDFNITLKIIGLYILEVLAFIPVAALCLIGAAISNSTISGAVIIAAVLFIIAIIAGIYLLVCLYPAMAFVLDKEFNSWHAFKSSFTATRGNFWSILVLLVFQTVIIAISIFPLFGIGLIWSFPLMIILFGEIYKRLLVNI